MINLIVGAILVFAIVALIEFSRGSVLADVYVTWVVVVGIAVVLLAVSCITSGAYFL